MEEPTCVCIMSQRDRNAVQQASSGWAFACLCVRRNSDWPYLDLDVPHFGCRANDWPANQCWEDVLWEVGPGIATLDKLKRREKIEKIISLKTKLQT